MRVLVVDDEQVSRRKMERIMTGLSICQVAESGKEALSKFEKAWEDWAPLDLITLDISMPDMDGTEVLYKIRKKEKNIPKEKRVKVIMVTARRDKDSIITSVQAGCDDYVTKPFDKETVVLKLDKLGLKYFRGNSNASEAIDDSDKTAKPGADTSPVEDATSDKEKDASSDTPDEMAKSKEKEAKLLDTPDATDISKKEGSSSLDTKESIIEEIKNRFQRKDVDLPGYSKIALKFRDMVDAGAGYREVSDLLRQDAAFTSKLISVSNSAYYRGVEENKTLEQAINRLGLQTTSQYVDVICNRALYFSQMSKKFPILVEKLWSHSLACAYASQVIMDTLNITVAEDPFMMGLFHDIGKLVLIQILSELERKGILGDHVTKEDYIETLNQLHVQFGCALLKRWEFSDNYVDIVKYHGDLKDAEPITKGLLAVHFSNLMVKSLGFDIQDNSKIDLENAESVGLLKLDKAAIEDIKQKVKGYILALNEILV